MATINGTGGNDSLVGTAANDTVFGLAGNDTLLGGTGSDRLYGGDGDDRLQGGGGRDFYDGGFGFDIIDLSDAPSALRGSIQSNATRVITYVGTTYPAEPMQGIEGIVGGAYADAFVGYGASYFEGRGGDDTLTGAQASDTLIGGDGADSLDGGEFSDTLNGGAGADTLIGGTGDDFLWGGGGRDVLDGGSGNDIASYADNTAPVLIDLAAGAVSFPGTAWPVETLIGIEGAEGGSGRDTLLGSDGSNTLIGAAGGDSLLGGGGDDILDGGAGADTVNGGAGFDTASFASTTVGLTIDVGAARAWVTGTTGARDVLVSIEAVKGGAGNDSVIGSTLGDNLAGGAGQDTLRGGRGDDALVIDPAAGRLFGYGDTLPDDGRDLYDGGAGRDTIVVKPAFYWAPGESDYYGELNFYVTAAIDLVAGTLRTSFSSAVDRLVSIENVTTSDGDDTVTGGADGNVIRTGDGANIVHAGAGNDTVYGGSSLWSNDGSGRYGDSLDGGSGNDLIYGGGSSDGGSYTNGGGFGPGTDTLLGGSGNDTLHAGNPLGSLYVGSGHVVMTGGAGADEFHLIDAAVGEDDGGFAFGYLPTQTVTDFDAAAGDRLVVEMVESGARIAFIGEAGSDTLSVHEAGYVVENGDTVLTVRLRDFAGPELNDLVITLEDYTGGLAPDELAFV